MSSEWVSGRSPQKVPAFVPTALEVAGSIPVAEIGAFFRQAEITLQH